MSRLECALRELESATAAVGSVAVEDFAESRAAMDRRAWAIADLAAMVAEGVAIPEQGREQILSRGGSPNSGWCRFAVRRRLSGVSGRRFIGRLAAELRIRHALIFADNLWTRLKDRPGGLSHTATCRTGLPACPEFFAILTRIVMRSSDRSDSRDAPVARRRAAPPS